MASIINAATSGGLISTGDTSGQLQLQTAGTTAIAISSAQVVTIQGITVGLGGGASSSNTAVGVSALAASTADTNSTAVGYLALQSNTSGTENTAMGGYALTTNVTGAGNAAFGRRALSSNTGSYNTGCGAYALYSNTSGGQNVAVGYQAFYSNANALGVSNVAVGWKAAYSYNGVGSNQAQVYIGASAGYYNVTGIDNTYVGGYSGYQQTGNYNTGLGSGALLGVSGSTGGSNTAVGFNACYAITSGSNNTTIGIASGTAITSGGANTCIGSSAGNAGVGYAVVTGGRNILIGYQANLGGSTSESNCICITTRGDAVSGKGSTTGYIDPGGGGVYQGNNGATWSVTSDQRLKKNIVDNTIGLEKINAIQVRNFEYKTADEVTDLPKHLAINIEGVQLGAIAQELQQVLPDCVKTESTGVMSVDATNITWHLINAVKELSTQVTELKAEVQSLKGA